MFEFFKILFEKKQLKKDTVDVVEQVADQPILQQEQPKPKIKKNIPRKEDIIIEEINPQQRTIKMAEIYLVVIDTTGRTEAKGFQPGIQNFYFVFANDDNAAKDIVLSTFKSRPHIMAALQYSTKATKLSALVRNMGPQHNFWTYIPFSNQRQPGQQAVPPKPEALLIKNEYGDPSAAAYTPQAPVGGEEITTDDLSRVQFDGKDGAVLNKLRPNKQVAPLNEEAPPVSPTDPTLLAVVQNNKELNDKLNKLTELLISQNTKPTRKKRNQTQEETTEQPE